MTEDCLLLAKRPTRFPIDNCQLKILYCNLPFKFLLFLQIFLCNLTYYLSKKKEMKINQHTFYVIMSKTNIFEVRVT